jgi:hypothetical protein
MYACMLHVYVYACIFVYVCMYLRMYAGMNVCTYACMHACMHAFTYGCVCVRIYVSAYACMCVCAYVCMCLRACMDVCACVHEWMCSCLHVCLRVCPCAVCADPVPRTRVCVRVCSCACARSRAAARTCVCACVPEFVRMRVCRLACAPVCLCINESLCVDMYICIYLDINIFPCSLVPPITGQLRCAAPPAPAVAFHPPGAFALGSAGGTSCPSGTAAVLSPAECEKAAAAAARPYGGEVRVYHWPPGCFWLTVGAGSFFLNTDFFPSSVYAQPVCAGAPGRCRHLCRILSPAYVLFSHGTGYILQLRSQRP